MANTYPLPAFHFIVDWGGSNVGFTEVTGLTYEIQAIEYRDGAQQGISCNQNARHTKIQ